MLEPIYTSILPHTPVDFIYHLADIHIPNQTKRHPEFRLVFQNLFKILQHKKQSQKKQNQQSIIVICGDIIHKSSSITPDCIQLVKDFFCSLSKIFPLVVMSGNHDDNVRGNDLKIDSLSSILNQLDSKHPIYYLRNTGIYHIGSNLQVSVVSVFQEKLIHSNLLTDAHKKKICLFHGMVQSNNMCPHLKAQGDYKFTVSDFQGYDMVMLGDIHRHYFLDEIKSRAYCGSLLQLNYGEDLETHGGCLEWTVVNNTGQLIPIYNESGYVILDYRNQRLIPKPCPKKSRIRLDYYDECVIDNHKMAEIETAIQTQLDCSIEELNINYCYQGGTTEIENFTHNKNDFLSYLQEHWKLPLEKCLEIYDIHETQLKHLGIENLDYKNKWVLETLEFKNILCFQEKQKLDFLTLKQQDSLWGILGKNAQGKSSLILVILFSLYGSLPDIKNEDILPKQVGKKQLETLITFSIGVNKYKITRTLKKVRLYHNENDITESEKKETEKLIHELIGNRDTLLNTNISLQEQHNNLIMSNNSDKLKIIKNILSLDIYDSLHQHIKDLVKDKKQIIKTRKISLLQDRKRVSVLPCRQTELDKYIKDKEKLLELEQKYQKYLDYRKLDLKKKKLEAELVSYNAEDFLNKKIKLEGRNQLLEEEIDKLGNLVETLYQSYMKLEDNLNNINISSLEEIKQRLLKKKELLLKNREHLRLDTEKIETNISKLYQNNDIIVRYQEWEELEKENVSNQKILGDLRKKEQKLLQQKKNHRCVYADNCECCAQNKKYNGMIDLEIDITNMTDEIGLFKSQLEIKQGKLVSMEPKNIIAQYESYQLCQKDMGKLEKLELKIGRWENDWERCLLDIENQEQKIQLFLQNQTQLKLNQQLEKEIQGHKKIINNNKKDRKVNKKTLEQLETEENTYKIKRGMLDNLLLEIDEIGECMKIEYQKTDLEIVYKNIGLLEQEIPELELLLDRLEEREVEMKELDLELENYSIYEKLTNWKGYPLFLIQKKIGRLENEINKVLSVIVDFRCDIELLENQKKGGDIHFYKTMGKSNGLVSKLGIPMRNCSGFEKFILSVAIRIGLIHISNYMIPNFMVIDEGFGTLDNGNLDKLGEVFLNIKQKFDLILIITHKEELKEKINNRILIDKFKIK